MAQATISFKTDPALKARYEVFARQYGLTPSKLLNIQMRELKRTKKLIIGGEEDFTDQQIEELTQTKEHKKLRSSLDAKFGSLK